MSLNKIDIVEELERKRDDISKSMDQSDFETAVSSSFDLMNDVQCHILKELIQQGEMIESLSQKIDQLNGSIKEE